MQNLIDSLEKSRNTTLDRMLVGLGIPNVGKKTAKQIASVIARNFLVSVENDKAIQVSDISGSFVPQDDKKNI